MLVYEDNDKDRAYEFTFSRAKTLRPENFFALDAEDKKMMIHFYNVLLREKLVELKMYETTQNRFLEPSDKNKEAAER